MTEPTGHDLPEEIEEARREFEQAVREAEEIGDLTGLAFVAYLEEGGRMTDLPGQGSGPVVHDGHQYVVLRNGNGVMAVYQAHLRYSLERLDRWPAEIEAY